MIGVFKAYSILDGELVDEPIPRRSRAYVLGILTSMEGDADGRPGWAVPLTIGEGAGAREMQIPLKPFVTNEEYGRSFAEPLGFSASVALDDTKGKERVLRWVWLYRDGIYVTERSPKSSEMDEVVLRIKALHFRNDKAMRRLSEQVANFEAVESQMRSGRSREPIPDDVKLLVWTRDGGACVKCGSAKELHFDHIIPLARGGSNDAANLQLLCRPCNLAKGDRLV